jgi:hypothetical protein
MHPETLFLDHRWTVFDRFEHDAFGRFHDFEVTAFVQTEPIPDRLRQNDATSLIHFECHTISQWHVPLLLASPWKRIKTAYLAIRRAAFPASRDETKPEWIVPCPRITAT